MPSVHLSIMSTWLRKESVSLKTVLVETPQIEMQREKKNFKNKSHQELWNNSKKHNIHILEYQNEKKETMELKKYLK